MKRFAIGLAVLAVTLGMASPASAAAKGTSRYPSINKWYAHNKADFAQFETDLKTLDSDAHDFASLKGDAERVREDDGTLRGDSKMPIAAAQAEWAEGLAKTTEGMLELIDGQPLASAQPYLLLAGNYFKQLAKYLPQIAE